jgi:hypothetical protein
MEMFEALFLLPVVAARLLVGWVGGWPLPVQLAVAGAAVGAGVGRYLAWLREPAETAEIIDLWERTKRKEH